MTPPSAPLIMSTVYGVGELPEIIVPGSFFLTDGTSAISNLIKFGQHIRFPGYAKTWDDFNHAGGFIDAHGGIVEMLARGAVLDNISKYKDTTFRVIEPLSGNLQAAADFWVWAHEHHEKYGWFAAISDGFTCLTGASLQVGTKGRMICSGMVAAGLCRAQVSGTEKWCPSPGFVFPGELGIEFGLAKLPPSPSSTSPTNS